MEERCIPGVGHAVAAVDGSGHQVSAVWGFGVPFGVQSFGRVVLDIVSSFQNSEFGTSSSP